MKVSEILELNLNDSSNIKILKTFLAEKLPFFKDIEPKKISVTDLERSLIKMCNKYPVRVSYIMLGQTGSNHQQFYYSAPIIVNNDVVRTIRGITIFEVFAKLNVFIYSYIKTNFRKD